MNIFESFGCLFGLIGIFICAILGHSLFGWIGAIVGVPVGFYAGFVLGSGIVFGFYGIGILKERIERRLCLKGHFGKFWSKKRNEEWKQYRSQHKRGEPVEGVVVLVFYYGAYLDIGVGFPALLARLHSDQEPQDPDLPKGSSVSARIIRFDNKEHLIELAQKDEDIEMEEKIFGDDS